MLSWLRCHFSLGKSAVDWQVRCITGSIENTHESTFTLVLVAQLPGTFVNNCVSGTLSDEQKGQLLHRFKGLCLTGLHTEAQQTNGNNDATLIRCNCCYNLPVDSEASGTAGDLCEVVITSLMFFPSQAVLVFSDATHFVTELYESFCSLCCDPEVSVRQSAAACFHQVSCDFFGFVLTMGIQEMP